MEEFGLSRKKAVYLTAAVMFAIGCAASYSMGFFDIADNILNNSLIIGGLVLSIFVGWSWGMDRFFEEAGIVSPAVRAVFTVIVKYAAPAVIIILGLSMHGVFG
jgi:NSS family neurotransmitter:Na+ symporter